MVPLISRRNLPLLLLRAREEALSNFRPVISHFGLTEQQWRILRTLAEQGEIEPCQIADLCKILPPSLAGVLARMEEAGLVRRRRHESDLRRVLVAATDRGHRIVEDAAPLIERQYELLEQALGPDVIAGLYRALDAYLDASRIPVPPVDLPATDVPVDHRKGRRRGEG